MKSQHRVFTDAISSCQSYRLQHKSMIFTEGFKEAVAELPLSYNKEVRISKLQIVYFEYNVTEETLKS